MRTGLEEGAFAHVAGTFDLESRTGTIDYVTPVKVAQTAATYADEGVHLIGEDANNAQLFDKPVKPQRNSCAPHARQGTFDDYVPVSATLRTVRLTIGGRTAAEFVRGRQGAPAAMSLGAPDPSSPHKVPLSAAAGAAPSPGVSYVVQAKADDAAVWQTLAVGLPTPTTSLDVNQFPGAKSIKVRVLQSDGFSENEVFQDTKTF